MVARCEELLPLLRRAGVKGSFAEGVNNDRGDKSSSPEVTFTVPTIDEADKTVVEESPDQLGIGAITKCTIPHPFFPKGEFQSFLAGFRPLRIDVDAGNDIVDLADFLVNIFAVLPGTDDIHVCT